MYLVLYYILVMLQLAADIIASIRGYCDKACLLIGSFSSSLVPGTF